MHIRPFLAVLFPIALSACQTGADGLTTSAAPVDISGAAASAIAGDMAGRFAEHASSTSPSIMLRRDKSEFSTALESALKGRGFTVVSDGRDTGDKDGSEAMVLAYSITQSHGQVLARLSADSLELGRVYSISNGVAEPASPLSVMKRN